MNSKKRNLDLTKETNESLKEMLNRCNALLKNPQILCNLEDEGKSIIESRKNIIKEIKLRENMSKIKQSFTDISLNSDIPDLLKEKHTQHLCQLDKPFEDKKYKPHKTLITQRKPAEPHKTLITQRKPAEPGKNPMDANAALEPKMLHEPIKFIPLSESLLIQSEQFQKAKEERAKQILLGFIEEDEEEQLEIKMRSVRSVGINFEDPEDEILDEED